MQQSTVLPSVFRFLESHHHDGSKRLIRFKISESLQAEMEHSTKRDKKVVQIRQLWIFPANTLAQKQILGHCLKGRVRD